MSYGWDFKVEICQSRRSSKGLVTLSANFRRKGRLPPITVRVRKLEWLLFHAVSKYTQCIRHIWFCQKTLVWQTVRQTDRQTYGQNYDSQDRASIAASPSRGKCHKNHKYTYIHTTKFIERQNREERIGGAGTEWLGSESDLKGYFTHITVISNPS